MVTLAGILITMLFAAGGFAVALKLSPDRKENRDKFLMTALVCMALAIVLSGLVRRPVMRWLKPQPHSPVGVMQPEKQTTPPC